MTAWIDRRDPSPELADLLMVSPQQEAARNELLSGKNVVVPSTYGSGKTRLSLNVFAHAPCLVIYYNARPRKDARRRLKESLDDQYTADMDALVHTVHSACGALYGVPCPTNEGLYDVLDRDPPLTAEAARLVSPVQCVLIDEANDIDPLLQTVFYKIVRDLEAANARRVNIMLVGDEWQVVYAYKGSDPRFMTRAHRLWRRPFVTVSLDVTWRCPATVVRLVNELSYRDDKPARGDADGHPKPVYCTWDPEARLLADNCAARQIAAWLDEGYAPDDICVIARSIKTNRFDPKLAFIQRALQARGVPTYQPNTDDAVAADDQLLKGKVHFVTPYAFKGGERKCVVVVDFDARYYDTFSEHHCLEPADRLPPPLHVALTRCKERMLLLRDANYDHVPGVARLLEEGRLSDFCDVVCGASDNRTSQKAAPMDVSLPRPASVSFLLRSMDDRSKKEAVAAARFKTTILKTPKSDDVPEHLMRSVDVGAVEDVSPVWGEVANAVFQACVAPQTILQTNMSKTSSFVIHSCYLEMRSKLLRSLECPDAPPLDNDDLYKMGIILHEINCLYSTRVWQARLLKRRHFSDAHVEHVARNARACLHALDWAPDGWSAGSERKVDGAFVDAEGQTRQYFGLADFVLHASGARRETLVIEQKYRQSVDTDCMLQLMLYAHCFHAEPGVRKRFALVNTRAGEMYELDCSSGRLAKALSLLRAMRPIRLNDDEFDAMYAIRNDEKTLQNFFS